MSSEPSTAVHDVPSDTMYSSKHRKSTSLMDEYQEPPKDVKEYYTLDQLLMRIGFGWYHIKLIIIIGLVAFSEGAQIIISTLCITILQDEWDFSDTTASLMTSTMFGGIVIGAAVSGKFADKLGRFKPLLYSLFLMGLFNVLSSFATDIVFFVVTRTLLGFFMGFFGPLGFTMVAENVPINQRGMIVMVATALMFIGELWGCFVALFTADNLQTGDWSAMILWSSTSIILAFILNFFLLDESTRYLVIMGKWDHSYKLIDKMIKDNKKEGVHLLTDDEKLGLRRWQEQLSDEVTDEDQAQISTLFKHGFAQTTVIIWLGWFINTFVYYGVVLFLPEILSRLPSYDQSANDIQTIFLSVLIESLSVVISMIVINAKTIGRKQFLFFFYILTAIVAFCGIFQETQGAVFFWATVTKIAINVCSFYFYLYTVEVYPTKVRATGMGMAAAVGKLGAIIMPWVCFTLMDLELLYPFLGWAFTCLATGLFVIKLPIDTKDKELK